jgi:DNA repair protein RadC
MAVKSESAKTYSSNPIHSWAVEDRPREKMSLKGKNALSDAELIAILLGSGNREDSAVEVAKKILKSVDNNLNALGELTLKDLQKTRGIGEAKAITIAAALELGLRRQASLALERPQIRSSIDAFHIMAPLLMDLAHEEFWFIALNRANKVVGKVKISSGGLSGTVVDSKKLFQRALEFERISALVLCHNHPSGNLKPSESDIELTKKLVGAALLLDMKVLDHIIIAGSGYMSFADSGYL